VAERTVGRRDLNRAVLARQLLLERVQLPLPRVLERIGGIQNQYAPNGYIRLFSCVEDFRRDDLTRALERRTVVQATLMRQTIHLVSKRDYWPLAVAVRASHREWLLRVRKPRPDERELERTAARLRAALAQGPRRYKELDEITGGRWHDADRGWSSCACRRPGRGTSAARTCSGLPRTGLVPRAGRPRTRSITSCGATSARSAPRRRGTSRAGRA
jgi:Winged helix DNA-binding domain